MSSPPSDGQCRLLPPEPKVDTGRGQQRWPARDCVVKRAHGRVNHGTEPCTRLLDLEGSARAGSDLWGVSSWDNVVSSAGIVVRPRSGCSPWLRWAPLC